MEVTFCKGSLLEVPWKLIFLFSDYEKLLSFNWTAILAVTQSNQSTGQPSWLSLNPTSKLDSPPGCHSIKPVSESWRPVGRLEGGVWGCDSPPRKYQMTAMVSQQLWTSGGALVQRAQEPNISCGKSLTSINEQALNAEAATSNCTL